MITHVPEFLNQEFRGATGPEEYPAVSAENAVFCIPCLDDRLASGPHEIPKAHACRTEVGAQIALQAVPDPALIPGLLVKQDSLDHPAR
jgi:hypothetical protein